MLKEAHSLTRPFHLATTTRTATRGPLLAVAVILVLGAALTFAPFVAPIVLALWAAKLSEPIFVRVRDKLLHKRERAAALLTGLLVLVAILPIALAVLALVPAVRSLFEQVRGASGGKGMLAALVSTGGGPEDGKGVIDLAKEYGAGASHVAGIAAGATLEVIVGALVFFVVFHGALVEGPRAWTWLKEHLPVEDRMARAFHQCGRGLIVGNGMTALVQGVVATILYAAFGVPRALLFGMLSTVAALIPMTGPMIVWIPVCLGLAFTGHASKAAILAALCAGLVGTIDNVVRPWLAKSADVGMSTPVVLVAMFGGVVVFGGWGIFLGPLVVRLAGEVLEICRERRFLYSKTP